MKSKGFTLIELLVVIAIIGILASVVLASLNSARAKGADTAIKANLANARAQAELFYDANSSKYMGTAATADDVCFSSALVSGVKGIYPNVAAATAAGSSGAVCQSSATGWAIAGSLKTTGKYWCVDSTGVAKGTQGSSATDYTAVSGAATAALTSGTAVTCN